MVDIQKYIDWANQGRRQVDITIDGRTNEVKVFCYDFGYHAGTPVTIGDQPPTIEELVEKKKESLRRELEEMG